MKNIAFLLVLLFFTLPSYSVDFSSLSREKPVMVTYKAEKKSNVSFILTIKSVKESHIDLFLKVMYVVDNDTLNDYLYLDETYSGMIKEIFLEPGDSVNAYIFLNNQETVKLDNFKGSFVAKYGPASDMQTTGETCKFTGTVWKDDQLPLFRIAKADEKSQVLNIDVSLTENFEFDKLHLKIKVISPAQGILLYSKTLDVNSEEVLPYRRSIIKIDFPDIEIQKAGSYYIQVFHQMAAKRINGVEYISYHLSDK